MNLEDCRRILDVPPEAGLDEIKSAFRKLAFRFHPDLNPAADAASRFRELNEAYVLLTHSIRDEERMGRTTRTARSGPGGANSAEEARARRAKAERAYARNAAESKGGRPRQEAWGTAGNFRFREEEVLRDLLADPFARQVFEDIYSQLKHDRPTAGPSRTPPRPGSNEAWRPRPPAAPRKTARRLKRRKLQITWGEKRLNIDLSRGVIGGFKAWLRGQLDDEQTVSFPAFALGPGRTVRLTIRKRFGEAKTFEVTLPPDFVIGRPVRLRGLGRKLGPFTGDLFLRVLAK